MRLKKPFYAIYRFLLGILATVWSGIECSPVPFTIFMLGALFFDWLLFQKIGYKESSCVYKNQYRRMTGFNIDQFDEHVERKTKFRRWSFSLILLVMACIYMLSRRHKVEFIVPILSYSGLVFFHVIYQLYRYKIVTAYPLGEAPSVKQFDYAYDDKLLINQYNPMNPLVRGSIGSDMSSY